MPIKIATVIPHPPTFTETFIATETRGLGAAGAEVLLVPISQPQLSVPMMAAADLLEQMRPLPTLNPMRLLRLLLRALPNLPRVLSYLGRQHCLPRRTLLRQSLRLAWLAHSQQVQHLHAHYANIAPYAILASRLLGIRSSFAGHGYDIYQHAPRLQAELEAADICFAVCAAVRREYLRQAPGARVEVLHCGVNTAEFEPGPGTDRSGFLIVGNLIEKKGVDLGLRAFANLDPGTRGKLHIVGEGPLRESLQSLAAELGIGAAVHWHGLQPAPRIRELMAQVRALLMPARIAADGDRDTAPIVCKEALACGLPIVVTDVVGLPEIVTVDCGFLLPTNDVAALSAAMSRVLALDEAAWGVCSAAARERALQHFDGRRLSARMLELLRL